MIFSLFSFLIDTSSGQVIGIDFGSAFNTATIVSIDSHDLMSLDEH